MASTTAVLALAACGSGFSDSSAPATQQTGPAALNVLVAGDPSDTAAVNATAGLVFGDTRDRIGAFMKQAGGWVTDAAQTQATATSPAERRGAEVRAGAAVLRRGEVPEAGRGR